MSKSYFVLVYDHAFQGDRHIAFEIGGGMCGSGFPDYDYYCTQFEPDIKPDDRVGTPISPMRRRMVEALSKNVKTIYLVNTDSHLLRKSLGNKWLTQFPNVQYFDDFKSFTSFALAHPESCNDAVVVVDCLARVPHLREDDYSAILREMKINIPVLNANGYRVFDDKVIFTDLFKGEAGNSIAKTWLVDKLNYKDILPELSAHQSDYYILKLPAKSNGRDTVIVEKKYLGAFVLAVMTKNKNTLSKIPLPATDPACFKVFIESLDQLNDTFVIRECIIPDIVKIGKQNFRAAARSVVLACYDTETNRFDFIQHIASYWQRPTHPVELHQPLHHRSLITANVQNITGNMGTATAVTFDRSEQERMMLACNVDATFTLQQLDRYLPKIINLGSHILERIANTTQEQATKNLMAPDPSTNLMSRYLGCKLIMGSLPCYDEAMLNRIVQLTPDIYNFTAMQTIAALRGLFNHQQPQLLPKPLLNLFDKLLQGNRALLAGYYSVIAAEIYALPMHVQKALVIHTHDSCPSVSGWLDQVVTNGDRIVNSAIEKFHKPAIAHHSKREYKHALVNWSNCLDVLKVYKPFSAEIVTTYCNMAACYRDLSQFEQAFDCYINALAVIAKSGSKADEAKVTQKFEMCIKTKREMEQASKMAKHK